MSFLTFGLSTQCKNKEHINQDNFGSVTVKNPSGNEVLVAAVSDGVSMCYKGEIASYNTIRFILNWAVEYFSKNDFDSVSIPEEFDKIIVSINQSINGYANAQKRKKLKEGYSPYPSCTLCCIITDGNQVLHFSVGDSTIFELKLFTINAITGNIRLNKHTNERGQLTSYIGGIEDEKIDIRFIEGRFDSSAAYFICTDGMYNKLIFDIEKDEEFRKFNQRLVDVNSKEVGISVLQGMTDYVLSKGETDDITALVIKEI